MRDKKSRTELVTKRYELKGGTMPAMPRFSKKGTKIAFKILGTPENLLYKPKGKKKQIDKQLLFQETTRIR